ncbi:DUF4291 family protein, partial [Streptomyces sp. SID625]|nr:DUF4291 family protein [Streptomyces sp. SID625]
MSGAAPAGASCTPRTAPRRHTTPRCSTCRWGTKEGQENVLAVEITRDGFEWALRHACLSHYERGLHAEHAEWKRQLKRAPARVQWDPERGLRLQPLPYRSLQLG